MISRRGLFGVFAGVAAAPLVKVPEAVEAATDIPGKGSEFCTVKWFHRGRGFGFLKGVESKHEIFIKEECLKRAGIEKLQLSWVYWVRWEMRSKGPMAVEVKAMHRRNPMEVIAELEG